MSSQLTPPPGGQQQEPAEPPSIKKTLLGLIPIAGPLLVAHGQQVYQRKKELEEAAYKSGQQVWQIHNNFGFGKEGGGLDPDTQLGHQQLSHDIAIFLEENPGRKLPPDLVKRSQEAMGKTTAQMAMQHMQAQQNVPTALNVPPPPGAPPQAQAGIPGMMPQGSGPARVNAPPGGPPPDGQVPGMIGANYGQLQPPPGMPQQQPQGPPDPAQQLVEDLQSPNPIIRGRAANIQMAIRNSIIDAQARMSRGQSAIQAYKESGAEAAGIPFPQFVEVSMGAKPTAAPMVTAKPGEVVAGPTGVPKFSVPQPVTTPEGATSTMVTPQPAAVGLNVPPPPGMAAPQSQPIATSPPKLNDQESMALDAAQTIAEKYGVPFDRTVNPRDPGAQIPTKLKAEFRATAAALKESPDVKAMRAESVEGRKAMVALAQTSQTFNQEFKKQQAAVQSRNTQNRALDTTFAKPVEDGLARVSRLKDALATNNIAADSIIAENFLAAVGPGSGVGVRMNQGMIDRIFGGRDHWESTKAAISKWIPGKAMGVTSKQRQDMLKLANTVEERLKSKQAIIERTRQDLDASDDPNEHSKILNLGKKDLAAIDTAESTAGLTGPPGASAKQAPIVQHSPSTGAYRYSTDGGKTWQAGQPPK